MSILTLVLTGLVALGGVISGILHHNGSQAAGTVDVIMGILNRLLGVLGTSKDPESQKAAGSIRVVLAKLSADPHDKSAQAEAEAIIRHYGG